MSHAISVEKIATGDVYYPRPPVFRAHCKCGWSAPYTVAHEATAVHEGNQHLIAEAESHDLGVEHSGDFARVVCSCGYRADWHHHDLDTFGKRIAAADSTHRFMVKNAGAS